MNAWFETGSRSSSPLHGSAFWSNCPKRRSGGCPPTAGHGVIDHETDEIREATCRDLRNLIKLKDSYGSGLLSRDAQDLPPLMRAVACFKICWESSDKTKPYDYLHERQTRYIYEMHK